MSLKNLGLGRRQFAPAAMLAVALGATLVARTVSSDSARHASIDPTIERAANAYRKAVLDADPAAIAAAYRDDGVELPQGCPPVEGRAAIEQRYRQLFSGPTRVTSFVFDHRESTIVGNLAYDVGAYTQHMALGQGGAIDDVGKYFVLLKRQGADWKIAYLIYNSDRQAAPPASSAR
jgi:uncharacterized protein (TIGR02246 family)